MVGHRSSNRCSARFIDDKKRQKRKKKKQKSVVARHGPAHDPIVLGPWAMPGLPDTNRADTARGPSWAYFRRAVPYN